MSIIVFGAGQIGIVVASILQESGQIVEGFVDDRSEMIGLTVFGLPVLGGRDWLISNKKSRTVCIGVGTIKARKTVSEFLDAAEIPTVGAIHPSALISPEVEIENDVVAGAGCVFFGRVRLGRGCYIGPSVTVSHDTCVGDWCLLSVGTVVGARVDISNDVFVGTASTLMEPGFGSDARLQIGQAATIGAGALVIRNVEPNTTVIGRPAKQLQKV